MTWQKPPDNLKIKRGEVHVWSLDLEALKSEAGRLRGTLSDDERQRADRFHFDRDRQHFIIARASLRNILSRYLNTSPETLSFELNDYGKPYLSGVEAKSEVRFNLSHSYGRAVYAVARGREVGIDIERIPADFDDLKIADRFFAPAEVAVLRSLSPELQRQGFFNCWARKEAFIKAVGQGVSFGLDKFEVTLTPDRPAALVAVNGSKAQAKKWRMTDLWVHSDYAAALVVEGHDWQLKTWQ